MGCLVIYYLILLFLACLTLLVSSECEGVSKFESFYFI